MLACVCLRTNKCASLSSSALHFNEGGARFKNPRRLKRGGAASFNGLTEAVVQTPHFTSGFDHLL